MLVFQVLYSHPISSCRDVKDIADTEAGMYTGMMVLALTHWPLDL